MHGLGWLGMALTILSICFVFSDTVWKEHVANNPHKNNIKEHVWWIGGQHKNSSRMIKIGKSMHIPLKYRRRCLLFLLLCVFFRFYLVDLFNFHSLTCNPSADYHQCEWFFFSWHLYSVRFQFLVDFPVLTMHIISVAVIILVYGCRRHWLVNKPPAVQSKSFYN